MSPYTKGALFVIRLIGAGFILFSLTLLGGDLFLFLSHRPLPSSAALFLKSLPFVLGVLICFLSYPLAKALTRDLDDESEEEVGDIKPD